ncbi:hypothetical protein NW768_005317 [Fusarium equiseti]|uniref:RRM domain-containing protein n=1 Tax=Fusarium equiseti TaxID=61235 RepID=A0ABQ8REX6_FUSEQ|nr:hypothetical protein NW768_005317 [Fusarium equiseti]
MTLRRETGQQMMSSPPEGPLMDSFQGTPDTRLTMLSPGEGSISYHHGGGYGGGAYSGAGFASYNAYAPHGSITGDRTVSHFDRDPFVDATRGDGLSPTASAFQPTSTRSKGKKAAVLLPEGSLVIANALSHEMDVSHRLEICDTPVPMPEEVHQFFKKLSEDGRKTHGNSHVETDGFHVYVCFEDLRDSISAFDAVRKADNHWLPAYAKVKPDRLMRGDVRFCELRQLDISVDVLDYAIADPSHVDEIVQRALTTFGSLFAVVRTVSFPNGGFRGVAQFCKAAKATIAFQTVRWMPADGIMICFKRPENTYQGVDGLTANMNGLVLSGSGTRGVMESLAPRAPEGNPWAPIAYQFSSGPIPAGPVYGNFYGNPTPAMSMNHSRFSSFAMGPSAGGHFGTSTSRRYPRVGRPMNPRTPNNIVDLYELMAGRDVRTTIMLRNIPNKVDQPLLKRIVDSSSFGKYDFMYLRIDFANDCNVGYAFINFVKAEYIIDFVQARANKRWNCFKSDKVAEVSYATIQGKDCLVQKFRNSSVMLEAEHYRPKLFYTVHCEDLTMVGQEEPFPGPDNQSKMKRSVENAEHVGLFTPTAGQHFREAQRHRHSQYDRGTRLAALEEATYENYGRYYRY